MPDRSYEIGRRKALSAGVVGLGGALIPNSVSAASSSVQSNYTDPDDDPLNIYLSNSNLHVDTAGYDDDELPAYVMEDVIDGFNSGWNAGQLDVFTYMSNPPISVIDTNPGGGIMSLDGGTGNVGTTSHQCDVTNDIEWERSTFGSSETTVTFDRETARELRDLYMAGTTAAGIAAFIGSATGVFTLPSWVIGGVAGLMGYYAQDIWKNIGDCGLKQEVTWYGPVPTYTIEPIDH